MSFDFVVSLQPEDKFSSVSKLQIISFSFRFLFNGQRIVFFMGVNFREV